MSQTVTTPRGSFTPVLQGLGSRMAFHSVQDKHGRASARREIVFTGATTTVALTGPTRTISGSPSSDPDLPIYTLTIDQGDGPVAYDIPAGTPLEFQQNYSSTGGDQGYGYVSPFPNVEDVTIA